MKSLRVATGLILSIAAVSGFSGAFQLLVFHGDVAAGWANVNQGVLLLVTALVVDGVATIAQMALDHLADAAASLRIIVGRRGEKR